MFVAATADGKLYISEDDLETFRMAQFSPIRTIDAIAICKNKPWIQTLVNNIGVFVTEDAWLTNNYISYFPYPCASVAVAKDGDIQTVGLTYATAFTRDKWESIAGIPTGNLAPYKVAISDNNPLIQTLAGRNGNIYTTNDGWETINLAYQEFGIEFAAIIIHPTNPLIQFATINSSNTNAVYYTKDGWLTSGRKAVGATKRKGIAISPNEPFYLALGALESGGSPIIADLDLKILNILSNLPMGDYVDAAITGGTPNRIIFARKNDYLFISTQDWNGFGQKTALGQQDWVALATN
jgi:hypothetical protein